MGPPDPPVDAAALAALQAAVGEVLGEVLDAYLSDAPVRYAALRAAVERRAAAEVANVAHTLKGSSAHFGARGLMDHLGALVRCARAGDLAQADALCARAGTELGRVTACLAAHRGGLRH